MTPEVFASWGRGLHDGQRGIASVTPEEENLFYWRGFLDAAGKVYRRGAGKKGYYTFDLGAAEPETLARFRSYISGMFPDVKLGSEAQGMSPRVSGADAEVLISFFWTEGEVGSPSHIELARQLALQQLAA